MLKCLPMLQQVYAVLAIDTAAAPAAATAPATVAAIRVMCSTPECVHVLQRAIPLPAAWLCAVLLPLLAVQPCACVSATRNGCQSASTAYDACLPNLQAAPATWHAADAILTSDIVVDCCPHVCQTLQCICSPAHCPPRCLAPQSEACQP